MSAAIWSQPSEAEPGPSASAAAEHVHVELRYDRDSTLWRLLLDGEPLSDPSGEALGWGSFNRAFDAKVRIENGESPPDAAEGSREAEPDPSR